MKFDELCEVLQLAPKRWLVTGAAGFIGSNLVEFLLKINQRVIALDNLSTGHAKNLEEVKKLVSIDQWSNFQFVQGDICDMHICNQVMKGVDAVLHQAAYGSVPKSIEDPIEWNRINVDGFLNILVAARDASVQQLVYASSSSVYGDSAELPKVEERIGKQLSPYAVTKYANELYAQVFAECYKMRLIGLRYFNVFGPRQDPDGTYAAVVPRWIQFMKEGKPCIINGDGETSRDFCYIKNVIQANLLAAFAKEKEAVNRVYNVGVNEQTDLKTLHKLLGEAVSSKANVKIAEPVFGPFRAGDVRHSLADITQLKDKLGFVPTHSLKEGIEDCVESYLGE